MKIPSTSVLLLALAHSTIAFYPYIPSWMCNDGECLAVKRSDGADSIQVLQAAQEIPTLKLRKMKSRQIIESQESGPEKLPRKVLRRTDIVTSSGPTQANSAAIDEDPLDYSYFAAVEFGSNQTPLWMLIDTGSFLTWVPSTGCKSLSCLNPTHKTYGPENSTTYNLTDIGFDLAYGTGSVKGDYVVDSLSFAGLSMDLSFGAANVTSDDFNDFPFDGILGLGNILDYEGFPTFMGVAAQSKLLKSNLFGIDLSRANDGIHDGEINFGAPDTSKYNGSLSYTPVVEGSGSWSIGLDDAGYDGKTAGFTGRQALIDTGTSFVILPTADAAQLFALVDNATINDAKTTYIVPCDTTTPIQFTFSGVAFDISPEDWIGPVTDSSKNLCASNIYPLDRATPVEGEWLVGDTFLKNVYSVFDIDENRVGFGAKTGSSLVATSSTASSSATGTNTPSSTESPLLPAGSSPTSSSTSSKTSQSASSSSTLHSSSAASVVRFDPEAMVGLALLISIGMLML